MTPEQRLIEIESKLAFQEHTISQLNEVVIAQQKRIEALEKTHDTLRGQLLNLSPGEEPVDEPPPPHY